MDFDQEITQILSRRLTILYVLLFFAFLVFFVRLWDLQILKGDYFFELSENNRIKIQEIIAPRGAIYDRNHTFLANNTPSFDVSLLYQGISDLEDLIPRLTTILNLDRDTILKKIEGSRYLPRFKPLKIKVDVSRKELSLIEFYKLDLPGVVVEVFPKRNYPLGSAVSHLLGFLGEINETELKISPYSSYNPGDFLGKSGIERAFEMDLRGKVGWLQFEVDATGRKKEVLRSIKPLPGENLVLTLDAELQCFTDKLLGEKMGTIIAINPQNGEVLAIVSHPSFDPNLFSRGISAQEWHELTKSRYYPLTNRAIQGLYPPGSVFKIITAIAGLEERKITPETTFSCEGSYRFGNRTYRCWKKGGHGSLNLYGAIEQSCDTYFYRTGHLVGVDSLAYYAGLFGLGSPTGLGLSNEKAGLIPTRAWKEKKFQDSWQGGETLSTAIGQSFTLVTPLQILVMISAIANDGKIYVPQLVKKIEGYQGNVRREFQQQLVSEVPVSMKSLQTLKEALRRVVQNPHGTGKIARIDGVEVAGKTGTAQVATLPPEGKKSETPFHLRDHAWFTAFAPVQNPEIAVVVLIEHGGSGSAVAGPLAKEVLAYYLSTVSR